MIKQATGKLSEIFEKAETKNEQVKVLEFQKNLLKAVKLVPDFQSSLKDQLFISDIVTCRDARLQILRAQENIGGLEGRVTVLTPEGIGTVEGDRHGLRCCRLHS
ncbi:hypothetical protein [Leptolyngbya sp. 7M]|uniref:hypothetical protein n=1 Tax=Leptolyngbya sp. 7M TaxID=2812896 RepID=UPI001B8C9AD5|nr:hypothetical protein [Leptolyngbya sp. 7M]QYO62230.1 hypothetical protein JVX88_19190 [Leptolyngbya sp. 7M]